METIVQLILNISDVIVRKQIKRFPFRQDH